MVHGLIHGALLVHVQALDRVGGGEVCAVLAASIRVRIAILLSWPIGLAQIVASASAGGLYTCGCLVGIGS